MPIKHQDQTRYPGQPSQAGFTLVELMVAVAVIGILAVIAMPSMTAMINNSPVVGQAEELVTSLQVARAEAVRRNARVTVCPSSDGATCAASTDWTRWIVHGMDNTADPAVDDVISSGSAKVQITGPARIVFKSSGLLDSSQSLEIENYGQKRCLTILISGVATVSKDACP